MGKRQRQYHFCRLCGSVTLDAEREQRIANVKPLRDKIIGTVLETIHDSQLTGDMESRLPHHASFAFKDVDGNLLLTLLDAALCVFVRFCLQDRQPRTQ